ncbi:MAG: nucleotidyltransferase [Thermogladius sp.]
MVVAFSRKALAKVAEKISRRGVEFVVIGSTAVELALNKDVFEGDLDLFVIEPSPVANEDFYRSLAAEEGWEVGLTELGTLKLVANVDGETVEVELYENIMDFNIPDEVVANTRQASIDGVKVRVLHPEQYFVLKARHGVDLDKLRNYYRQLGRLNTSLLEATLSYFPEESEDIAERLRSVGFKF